MRRALLLALLLSCPARAEVLVRWRTGPLPARDVLGVTSLVVPAGGEIERDARALGYRVYVEGDASLQINDTGKWPRIRSNVRSRRGQAVQTASRTAQPWLDNNVALIRILRAAGRRPVLGYPWKPDTQVDAAASPSAEDFHLAIAEAGAFGADLVLDLDAANLDAWKAARPTLDFYSASGAARREPITNVGVVARDTEKWYEVLNLLARHNVPYRILQTAPAAAADLDLVVLLDPGSASALPAERVLQAGEDANDPNSFALKVWNRLGRKGRWVDIWNGITVLAELTRKGAGVQLDAVNYSAGPLSVQSRVRGSYKRVEISTPEHDPQPLSVEHVDGFTEFVIPELRVGARVRLTN